jgi:hypothetical protein
MINYVLAFSQMVAEGILPKGLELNPAGGEFDYDALVVRGAAKPSRADMDAAFERYQRAAVNVPGALVSAYNDDKLTFLGMNGTTFSYRVDSGDWTDAPLVGGAAVIDIYIPSGVVIVVEVVEHVAPFRRGVRLLEG